MRRFTDAINGTYSQPMPIALSDGHNYANAHIAAVETSRSLLYFVALCVDADAIPLGCGSIEKYFDADSILTEDLSPESRAKMVDYANHMATGGSDVESRLQWERSAVLGDSCKKPANLIPSEKTVLQYVRSQKKRMTTTQIITGMQEWGRTSDEILADSTIKPALSALVRHGLIDNHRGGESPGYGVPGQL